MPKRIKVCHIDLTVSVDSAAVDLHGEGVDESDGIMSERHSLIAIRPLPEPRSRTVLLHELLHACIAASGAEFTDTAEERFVSMTTGPLLAALRDNPRLVTYLTA